MIQWPHPILSENLLAVPSTRSLQLFQQTKLKGQGQGLTSWLCQPFHLLLGCRGCKSPSTCPHSPAAIQIYQLQHLQSKQIKKHSKAPCKFDERVLSMWQYVFLSLPPSLPPSLSLSLSLPLPLPLSLSPSLSLSLSSLSLSLNRPLQECICLFSSWALQAKESWPLTLLVRPNKREIKERRGHEREQLENIFKNPRNG